MRMRAARGKGGVRQIESVKKEKDRSMTHNNRSGDVQGNRRKEEKNGKAERKKWSKEEVDASISMDVSIIGRRREKSE
jgi:hypothetical protein